MWFNLPRYTFNNNNNINRSNNNNGGGNEILKNKINSDDGRTIIRKRENLEKTFENSFIVDQEYHSSYIEV